MDNLISHIEYLILRHDCVVIPTLGAFIAHSQSARYDEEYGCFLPECREISFNEDIRHDDALIAASFARKDGVTIEEGKRRSAECIRQAKQMLMLEGEITIGRLGTLRLCEEGNLVFQPIADAIEKAASVGRMPINVTPLKNSVQDDGISETQTEAEPCSENICAADSPEKIATAQRGDNDYYIIRIKKKALKYAAMLIIVFGITLGIAIPYSYQSPDIDRASVLPIDSMIDSARKKELLAVSQSKQDTTVVQVKTDTLKESEKEYHIVVSAFLTLAEADRYMKARKDSSDNLKVYKSTKYYMVAAASDDSKENLLPILRDEKFKRRYKDAWIWHKQK